MADPSRDTESDRFYELQGMYCDVLCRLTAQLSDMAIVGVSCGGDGLRPSLLKHRAQCLVVLDKASKRSLLRARRSMTP